MGCGLPDFGMWVAGFRVVGACFGLFGHEKWRATGGGVRWWLSWAEGTRRPFLSPATGGGDARQRPVAPEREKASELERERERERWLGGIGVSVTRKQPPLLLV